MAPATGEGVVVRDRKWSGKYTGTVVRREGDSVFVAWHGSFVEYEMDVSEVEVWEDAPTELRAWRGGIGAFDPATGSLTVERVA